jgi:hypothetical protein
MKSLDNRIKVTEENMIKCFRIKNLYLCLLNNHIYYLKF